MQAKEALFSHFWKYLVCFDAAGLLLWGNFALRPCHDQPLLNPARLPGFRFFYSPVLGLQVLVLFPPSSEETHDPPLERAQQ